MFAHPNSPFALDVSGAEPRASVFMRLDHAADAAELTAKGAEILLQRDELVIARMPISNIATIAAIPGVRSMALSKRWFASLDSSRNNIDVNAVFNGSGGLPQAYKGDGVVVGVLDSGIDYTHDDFRTAPKVSRLQGLFDFSQGSNGAECTKTQLDTLGCPEIDGSGSHGHGTHVTGIAAGNGALSAGKYRGMAPNADIVFVKGIRDAQSNGGFTDADVVNGTAWILDKAAQLHEPVAINLSLGSQFGAHDGTSLEEQFLDRFTGPGRIIVAAAGNSGRDPVHVSYSVAGTSYNDINTHETGIALLAGVPAGTPSAVIDMWAPVNSDIHVGIAVYRKTDLGNPVFVSSTANPGQHLSGTATAQVAFGSVQIGDPLGDVDIDARTTKDANNGQFNIVVLIGKHASTSFDPASLFWSIYTTGSGTFDMWANGNCIFLPRSVPQPSYFVPGDSLKTIGIPATAKRILCVGSHVSKTQWTDVNNVIHTETGATLNAVSGFSSRGPSRDNRMLPNFTAPGEVIISALSSDFPADPADIALGGGYQRQQGTSQASPHVTGVVALMLERDPALTPENARAILAGTTNPANTPNNTQGSGHVDALGALISTPDPLNCMVVVAGKLVSCAEAANMPMALMAYPNPAGRSMRLSFVSPARQRVHLALYDIGGRRMRTMIDGEIAPGVQNVSWNGEDDRGHPLPSGVYFAKLITPSASRSIRVLLAR